uniref:Shisa family member 6 n=1 Tax=Ornithorhynchus anatinus TaxID=9258 RepID=A0A6I8NN15_ORNAN
MVSGALPRSLLLLLLLLVAGSRGGGFGAGGGAALAARPLPSLPPRPSSSFSSSLPPGPGWPRPRVASRRLPQPVRAGCPPPAPRRPAPTASLPLSPRRTCPGAAPGAAAGPLVAPRPERRRPDGRTDGRPDGRTAAAGPRRRGWGCRGAARRAPGGRGAGAPPEPAPPSPPSRARGGGGPMGRPPLVRSSGRSPSLAMALRPLLLLLLLLALEPLHRPPPAAASAGSRARGNRTSDGPVGVRRPGPGRGGREANGTARPPGPEPAGSRRGGRPGVGPGPGPGPGPAVSFETCWGYYDVSGQYDKEFVCNNSDSGYLYCCGTCYYRFCCKKRHEKLDQRQCRNYVSPVWVQTPSTRLVSPGPEDRYDPDQDRTNFTVYITCGVIAVVIVAGVFAKVSYDKARRPPREMNIHRALADILRQQGPIPIAHCERETISALASSPKENTPVRSTAKTQFTPVRTAKPAPGLYSKDSHRGGGPDLHSFISSGFVTLGRGHTKEKPRMSILTSATEPYDLSFSRSFQNLAHLPPSYESTVKTNPSKYSSLKRLTDKEADEYYMRRRHLPDLAARGTLPLSVIHMSQKQPTPRERPRRPMRAMSQDRVLSPERGRADPFAPSPERILSDERLLSAELLRSQDPLLSPERAAFAEPGPPSGLPSGLQRALSHTDVFVSTPVLDRYRMTKMHSHPSASSDSYHTLGQSRSAAKRQAFASRRHNTVEQLHYIPGPQHYHTASKTEVTV